MKKYYQYITLAALTFSFAACTQEDDFVSQSDADAVKITANIGKLQTRVSYDGTTGETFFDEGDLIRVINHTRSGKSKSDAIYKTDGNGNWSPVDNTNYLVWEGSSANTFYGMYPITASYTAFTIPTDQSDDITAADWMTDDYVGNKSEGSSVDFNLLHRLAKVTVKITNWNSEFDGSEQITAPAIYSKGETATATYSTDTETGAQTVTITSDGMLTAIAPLVSGETFTAIVAPADYDASDTFMTLTVDGQPLTVLAKSSRLTGDGLKPGKHYTFNLTVGKDAAVINSVNVTDWNPKDIEGGVATEEDYAYNESTNTYIVRAADALNTAISNAGTSGTTDNPAIIKLTADVEVTGTPNGAGHVEQALLVDNGVITLDLNGHTITSTGEAYSVIKVDNGATLTIDDNSVGKQGKLTTAKTAVRSYNGKLVINGGTFEGEFAVEGWSSSIIEINGGTFIATDGAVRAQSSTMTITSGTFTGGSYALSMNSNGTPSITGGSFSGKKYDMSMGSLTGFLSYNQETGTGPTFPDGLSIYTSQSNGFNLNALLADGAAYYDADGAKIELDDSAASYDGDVTVKKVAATE